jgi:putative transposase
MVRVQWLCRFKKLSHTIWHCEYHIVWVPKYRLRILKALLGELFLGLGYCVETIGLDEEMIRNYIKYQERNEKKFKK